MLSWPIDPARLGARLPASTELDLWDGQALVSVVAFLAEGSPVTVCRGRRIAP